MYIRPVQRARVRRQLRPTTTRTPSPIESLISNAINPGETSTKASSTTTRLQPTPSPSPSPSPAPAPNPDPNPSSSSSSSTSTTTSSTSAQRTTSSSSPSPPPLSTVTRTSTSTSPSGPSTTNASNNGNQPSANGMTPLVKGIVISLSVVFGLIFLALVIRRIFQFRRSVKRVSWAETISPFAPTAKETGYEKPPPQPGVAPVPVPLPVPVPVPAHVPTPPSSRMSRASYGAMSTVGYGGVNLDQRGSVRYGGVNLDQRNSVGYGGVDLDQRSSYYSSTGTAYATYQNYPPQPRPMRPYSLIAAPQAYLTAGMGAGAAIATAVGGAAAGMTYISNDNNNNDDAVPVMPNPFAMSAEDVAGPPAAEQQILVVTRTFTPNLDDELPVATGESVAVIAIYDDGWCKVRKLGVGDEEGTVPYECLADPTAGVQGGLGPAQDGQARRSSSLCDVPRA